MDVHIDFIVLLWLKPIRPPRFSFDGRKWLFVLRFRDKDGIIKGLNNKKYMPLGAPVPEGPGSKIEKADGKGPEKKVGNLNEQENRQSVKDIAHQEIGKSVQKDQRTALESKAVDLDSEIRKEVANNPDTPPDILSRLAGDKDYDVRMGVIYNPNTPDEAYSRLAGESDNYLRKIIAGNPNVPPDVLARLAGDPERDVRQNVAENKNTPPESLRSLAGDEDEVVKKAALATLVGESG